MSDASPIIKAALQNPSVKAELDKPEVRRAIEKIKAIFWETVAPWTADDWARVGTAALGILHGLKNIPDEFRKKTTGTLESSFFAIAYGLFIAVWAQFELTVEILVMRQLRLTPQEASIVCGGLSFGAKIHMLLSLLARDDTKNSDGILMLKQAQSFADRNSFAHGFLYDEVKTDPPDGMLGYTASLIKREIKYEYVAKIRALDVKTMAQHVTEFSQRHSDIKKHFAISEEDAKAYQKSILDDALAQEDRVKRRHESLTSSRTAKQKRRGLEPQSFRAKASGLRPSSKQRRQRALLAAGKRKPKS